MADSETEPAEPMWKHVLRDWVLPIIGVIVLVQIVGALRAPDLPDEAPDFTLQTLDGEWRALSEYRGQTVVLNFWATWCGPCRAEIPSLSSWAQNHPEMVVLGVVADGPPAKVKAAARSWGITYPVLMGDRATLDAYKVGSYPTTIVVGPDGEVSAGHVGIVTRPQLWWLTRSW